MCVKNNSYSDPFSGDFWIDTKELSNSLWYVQIDLKCMVLFCRALTNMKLRLKGAQKGHSLLKKKADALTLRFRAILKKIIEVSYIYRSSFSFFLILCARIKN
jgi:hypothetical protein